MTQEKLYNQGGTALGPDAASDGFITGERHVEVIHGVYSHSLPLVGMTVAQARDELTHRMNIDPDAVSVVDGQEVDENTVLQEGQVLNFVKRAGEKG
jgi:hypothetical protein